MSEEIEIPIEKLQEDIHHAIHHSEDGSQAQMMTRAAILSALLAVAAAISALFAGHYSNEAMIEQIQSTDKWAHYQAKGIKRALSEVKLAIDHSEDSKADIESYKEDQTEIKAEAEAKEHESQEHLRRHETLAASVTLFQVAIGLTAISVLTRKRRFLSASAVLGLAGLLWTIKGFWL